MNYSQELDRLDEDDHFLYLDDLRSMSAQVPSPFEDPFLDKNYRALPF